MNSLPAGLRVKRGPYHISCVRVYAARLQQSAFSLSRSFIQPEQFSCELFFLSLHRKAAPRCCFRSRAFLRAPGVGQAFSLTLSCYVDHCAALNVHAGYVGVDLFTLCFSRRPSVFASSALYPGSHAFFLPLLL